MKYLILDEETQIHQSHKRKANPFHPDNYIVYRGWKKEGDEACSYKRYKSKKKVKPLGHKGFLDDVHTIVAHNAKFEMLYEMMVPGGRELLMDYFARGGKLYCTQYAEYLINGQQRKFHMNSLDNIVETYGGRKKIDGMKELWDAGVQTSDIDEGMVVDYLIGTKEEKRNSGDIGNTELVYLGQQELIKDQNMERMIPVRMDGLCATVEMEFNGIHIDRKIAAADMQRLMTDLDGAEKELAAELPEMPEGLEFSWGSTTHKSCLIYGGTIRYKKQTTYLDPNTGELARLVATEKWPLFDKVPHDPNDPNGHVKDRFDGFYYLNGVKQDVFLGGARKGEPKFKNVKAWGELKVKFQDFFHTLPRMVDPDDVDASKGKNTDGMDGPLWSTDSDTVELLEHFDVPFLKAMSLKAKLDKELGTYYCKIKPDGEAVGMLTCVDPAVDIVHHMLNHTSTVTARLSSSNPNFQNIPRGDKSRVKAMLTSRFDGGVMGEIDYSQLEVVCQGLLSLDKNLVADLNKGVDFHCVRVAAREGCTYEEALEWCKNEEHIKNAVWKVFRTECKIFSFQRAYGAGAATIALTANMTVDVVKDMMVKEDKMYPGVVKFNASVEKEVNATAEAFRDPERGYRTFRRGTWQAPTGTLYSWRSWDAPKFMREKGIVDTFSPPELKNYPVQGTGGEIVQMALGVLWRWFMVNRNFGGKALLCNTVHDCVWFDMMSEVVDQVIEGSKAILEAVPAMLKGFFDIDCPVKFPVDAEVGDDLLTMKHWHKAAA